MLDEIDRQVNAGQSDQLDELLQNFLANRDEGANGDEKMESPMPAVAQVPRGAAGMGAAEKSMASNSDWLNL